jgi:hypothetical protein
MSLWFNINIHEVMRHYFFSMAREPKSGLALLMFEVSQSLFRYAGELFWTSDQPVAKASTYTGQHNTETERKYPCPERDANPRSQQPSDQDLRLRPRGHRDRPYYTTAKRNIETKQPTQLNPTNAITEYYTTPGRFNYFFTLAKNSFRVGSKGQEITTGAILGRLAWGVWIGFDCLRTGTGGGLL